MASAFTPTARRSGAVSARVLVLLSALVVWTGCFLASANERPQRILLLEGQSATQPGGVRTFEAFRARVNEKSRQSFEIDFDHLDLARFPVKPMRSARPVFSAASMRKSRSI
jgi:hypothetical protein